MDWVLMSRSLVHPALCDHVVVAGTNVMAEFPDKPRNKQVVVAALQPVMVVLANVACQGERHWGLSAAGMR